MSSLSSYEEIPSGISCRIPSDHSVGFRSTEHRAELDTDPVLEQDAKHNLDVAWQAFTLKKAYKGALMRFEETFAAYPSFSKMDEFLYIAGMSSYYLSENKGKQKIDLKSEKEKDKFAPAKLKRRCRRISFRGRRKIPGKQVSRRCRKDPENSAGKE